MSVTGPVCVVMGLCRGRCQAGDFVAEDDSPVPRVSHSGGCLWNSGRASCSACCVGSCGDGAGAPEPGARC